MPGELARGAQKSAAIVSHGAEGAGIRFARFCAGSAIEQGVGTVGGSFAERCEYIPVRSGLDIPVSHGPQTSPRPCQRPWPHGVRLPRRVGCRPLPQRQEEAVWQGTVFRDRARQGCRARSPQGWVHGVPEHSPLVHRFRSTPALNTLHWRTASVERGLLQLTPRGPGQRASRRGRDCGGYSHRRRWRRFGRRNGGRPVGKGFLWQPRGLLRCNGGA